MKYKGKIYKKVKKPVRKGDLIVLHCRPNSDYVKYNGVHEVISNQGEIKIFLKEENGIKYYQGIKLGYNVYSYDDYSKLVEVKRKKSLPMPVKEEQEY